MFKTREVQYIHIPVWKWFEYDNSLDDSMEYDSYCDRVNDWLVALECKTVVNVHSVMRSRIDSFLVSQEKRMKRMYYRDRLNEERIQAEKSDLSESEIKHLEYVARCYEDGLYSSKVR